MTTGAPTVRAITVDSPPAASLSEAQSLDYRNTSDEAIVIAFVKQFYEYGDSFGLHCKLPTTAWSNQVGGEHRAGYLAVAGAVLYVLANYGHFQPRYPSEIQVLLDRCGGSPTNTTWQMKAQHIRGKIHDSMRADIRRVGRLGTHTPGFKADFDMALFGLGNLLYLFIDDPVSLPPDLARHILCMGNECDDPPDNPAKWGGCGAFLTFDIDWPQTSIPEYPRDYFSVYLADLWTQSETENHALNIYLWNYLATNFILRRGRISSPGGPLYNADVSDWYQSCADEVLDDPERFYDNLLQILGRVMHNGFFEHNSRPYQKYTISAILTAAIYGSPGGLPDTLIEYVENVRQAARNAFGYAATAFALQALRGKRSSPWRRRLGEYKYRLGYYKGNLSALTFGLMSGAREWNGCSDHQPECRVLNYRSIAGRSWVFWPSIARHRARINHLLDIGYELPEPIHGLMFDKGPFYARLQSRFTKGNYVAAKRSKPYFVNESEAYVPEDKDWKSTPELYFRTGDLMLAAGGQGQRYYAGTTDELEVYNVVARPTMLFGLGNFGHTFDSEIGDVAPNDRLWRDSPEHTMGDALHKVMLMPGKHSDFWESTCNVWVYRNFAYVYQYHDSHHSAPGDWYEGFPQRIPDRWMGSDPVSGEPYLKEEFSVQSARDRFRIFEFPADPVGEGVGNDALGDGVGKYYLILSRIYKEQAEHGKDQHSEYRRGFVEVVPGHLYGSAEALKQELLRWNRPEFDYLPTTSSVNPDRPFNYRYVLMSSKERLTLDPLMGSKPNGNEDCRAGILNIEYPRVLSPVPALSVNDWYWSDRDVKDALLPTAYRDDEQRRDLPLITAWELNGQDQTTGRRVVEVAKHGPTGDARHKAGTPRHGHIVIRRPVWTEYQSPTTDMTYRRQTWQCLELDSHNYKEPRENYMPMVSSYEDCFLDRGFKLPNVAISSGGQHSCAVKLDGSAWCWGDNSHGQLGAAVPTAFSVVPLQVTGRPEPNLDVPLQDVVDLSAGSEHTCAVRNDGTVMCWGSNEWGQLGVPTSTTQSDAPLLVYAPPLGGGTTILTGVQQVSAGEWHTCVVRQPPQGTREVLCWGANHVGQLGDGTQQSHFVPALVQGLPEVEKVSAGMAHTCAVDVDGGAWCWGWNSYGQLGDGTTTLRTLPVQVQGAGGPGTATFESVVSISAGSGHTCAIKYAGAGIPEGDGVDPDNSVWCWGWNQFGQLGDGTRVDRPFATRLPSTTGGYAPVDITAGAAHACTALASGETRCWGVNHNGELGDGSYVLRDVPTTIPGFDARAVSAGDHHTCAIQDEEVWCWGWNQMGQLGLGHTVNRNEPSPTLWQ